jgi:lysozyme
MDNLIEMLKRHEGVKSNVYRDTGGLEHIGCGRNISESGPGLSEDEINYLLKNDLERCEAELNSEYVWFRILEGARRDAIMNIFFNLGATRFRGFKNAIAAMENQDYDTAAVEFMDSRWAKQVGGRALELTDIIKAGSYV